MYMYIVNAVHLLFAYIIMYIFCRNYISWNCWISNFFCQCQFGKYTWNHISHFNSWNTLLLHSSTLHSCMCNHAYTCTRTCNSISRHVSHVCLTNKRCCQSSQMTIEAWLKRTLIRVHHNYNIPNTKYKLTIIVAAISYE